MSTHKTLSIASLLLLLSLILLAACGPAAPKTPTPDANAVFTQAVQTVAVQLTQNAALTPAVAPTNQPLPTETSPSTAPTVEQPAVPSAATNTLVPTALPAGATQDGASFVEDVTIPDDTGAAPGVQFVKTWRIKNTGKTTWTADYALVPIDGDHMGSPDSIPMPTQVRPGETVDISVKLTAPTKVGSYKTYFRLRNASGQFFRLDGTGDLWLKIVVGVIPSITPTRNPKFTDTPIPTATETAQP